MDTYDRIRIITATAITLLLLLIVFYKFFGKKLRITTDFITKTGIFAALSIILYTVPFLKFSLPIFPAFLEIHLDEIPAFIAGFAYGPFCGFFVILIKTLVKLPLTSTMGVGELADFIYSVAFVIPAAIIYKQKNSLKGALLGLGVGTIVQLIVSSFVTSFAILNFYMFVMGLSEQTILAMCQAVNPNVTSLGFTFLFLVALPFNALKDAIVIVATIILYKRLHILIDRLANKRTQK